MSIGIAAFVNVGLPAFGGGTKYIPTNGLTPGLSPPPPPPGTAADVCLDAVRTRLVSLTASTEHARACEGGNAVADAALRQKFTVGPAGIIDTQWTLPAADVPTGGIGSWTIKAGFADSADLTVPAANVFTLTVTQAGIANVTDAIFSYTGLNTATLVDSNNIAGNFSFNDVWAWTVWRTDAGQTEVLSSGRMIGLSCVKLP